MNDVSILGLGASGHAAARLVLNKGGKVYVSDTKNDASTAARGTELEALGERVQLGGHDLARIAGSSTVVVSPGIHPDADVLRALRERGGSWISELELAVRFFRGPLIAVTGTNGKTTTCAVLAHLLEAGGSSVGLGGNIGAGLGPAASELALRDPAPDWYVLEVSSFQLADVETFRPDVGVLTNLAPDHLDRYPTVAAYYRDKARLFENADEDSCWVLNADDAQVLEMASAAKGRKFYFSTCRTDVEGGVVSDEVLTLRTAAGSAPTPLLHRADLPLLGTHNVANALAASVTAHLTGVSVEVMGSALAELKPLPHRLEAVADLHGVLWVNDSKATNVAATVSAVRSLGDRPLVVLLGGKDKGEDFRPLAEALVAHARTVLLFGAARERLQRELGEAISVEPVSGPLARVLERAGGVARPGDTVLFSPACSSFDQFQSYEERGRRFTELARAIAPGVAH